MAACGSLGIKYQKAAIDESLLLCYPVHQVCSSNPGAVPYRWIFFVVMGIDGST